MFIVDNHNNYGYEDCTPNMGYKVKFDYIVIYRMKRLTLVTSILYVT